jgi:[protein-PII] uridylyltransferase
MSTIPVLDLPSTVASERTRIETGRAALRAAYEARPLTTPLLRGHAALIDAAIVRLWKACNMPASVALLRSAAMGAANCSRIPTSTC